MLRFQTLAVLLVFTSGCASLGSGKSWLPTVSWPGGSGKAKTDKVASAPAKKTWMPSWQRKPKMEDALRSDDAPMFSSLMKKKKSPAEQKADRLEQQLALGNSQEQASQWEKARDVYHDLVTEYPDSAQAKHRLAVVYDRLKRHTEAQRLYAEALAKDPKNAEVVNDLGYSQFLAGKLDLAEAAFSRAVELDGTNARYHNNLGMVYGHQGNYDRALTEFRKAGSDADSYYNLAFVYASQEKHAEAKLSFQKALLADPSHSKSRSALASFERYDRTPPELRDENDLHLHDDSTRWVAYVEGDGGDAEAATAEGSADTSGAKSTGQILQTGGAAAGRSSGGRASGVSADGFMSNRAMQALHYKSQRGED